jgi:WW domain
MFLCFLCFSTVSSAQLHTGASASFCVTAEIAVAQLTAFVPYRICACSTPLGASLSWFAQLPTRCSNRALNWLQDPSQEQAFSSRASLERSNQLQQQASMASSSLVALPDGWMQVLDDSSQELYYYNELTGESTCE